MITVRGAVINFKLAEPISISFHTWHYSENILVFLKYKQHTGIGEAAPFKPITGDSQEDVIEELKKVETLAIDPKRTSPEDFFNLIDKKTSSQTLKAALDFAYHDLLGKIKGIPSYKLYVEKPRYVNNSVTVFIKNSLEETAKEAKRLFNTYPDARLLKIKLKGDQDIERVRAIKTVAPKGMRFTLDANQGFSDPEEASQVLTQIGNILENVTLVEEPCPKGELEKLKYVKNHVQNMLVFADESAATYEDAQAVVKAQAAHGINIKLQKAGGIWPAKMIAKLGEKANMQVMVGCMLEGPVSIAAGVHFAISTPNIISSDLDMDLDMPKHAKGEPLFKKGQRIPSDNPGLGVTIDMPKVAELHKKGFVQYREIK